MPRIQEAILGGRLHPGLGWGLATIGVNFAAFSALMVYAGPWLVHAQHASLGLVSTTLFAAGVAGAVGALGAGRLIHSVDRRRLIITASVVQTAATAVMALPVSRQLAIAALMVAVGAQPLRGVAQRTLIADADAGEKGFADFRLAIYLGTFAGPAAAGLLVGWGWPALRAGVTAIDVVSLACAIMIKRSPSRSSAPAPAMGVILRDQRLWLLLAASTMAWTVMYAFETVLPTLAVGPGHISTRQWGLLYSLGPLMVLVSQLRIQRALRRLPAATRLTGGLVMMGLAFGLFTLGLSAATLIAFMPVFLTGDMIWGPASDDLVARVAPPGRAGAYFGAATATIWMGSALAPAIGLPAAQAFGDASLWWGTAAVALMSAFCYLRAAAGEPVAH